MRELAYRAHDGLEVRLLCGECDNRVAVTVKDARSGERFVLQAEKAYALDAFTTPTTTLPSARPLRASR